jgi:hypothetical protein
MNVPARRRGKTHQPHLAAVVLALCLTSVTFAADHPSFRKGLWEFNRTIEPQVPGGKATTMTTKQCTDPTVDMKRMNDMLTKQGCKFSPVSVRGNVYSFSSACRIQGVPAESQSVITAESENAYTVHVTASGSAGATKELLVAKRVGDCQP